MRKVLFLSAALFIAGSMSSCKKNWTCTCTISGTTVPSTLEDETKSQATSSCNTLQTEAQVSAPGSTCTLN